MVSYKEVLYVAETEYGSILAFNMYNQQFLGTVVHSPVITKIEQLTLSSC
jgi:hypothetical protein